MFSELNSTVHFARATLLGFEAQRRYETSAKIATTGLTLGERSWLAVTGRKLAFGESNE